MERGGNTITSPDEIADALAGQYANISGDPYKKNKPGRLSKKKKKEDLPNIKPFTDNKIIEHQVMKALYIPR